MLDKSNYAIVSYLTRMRSRGDVAVPCMVHAAHRVSLRHPRNPVCAVVPEKGFLLAVYPVVRSRARLDAATRQPALERRDRNSA